MSKQLRLVLIGFGNAAQAFVKLLLEKERYLAEKEDVNVLVSAIAGNRKGALIDSNGLDLRSILNFLNTNSKFENALDRNTLDVIAQAEADVAVELSPLSIADGQPAIGHIKAALNRGMHVVTANKGPIAWAFEELSAMAESRGVQFLYETTVMDGAPIFNLARHCLNGCEILSFEGILNTTTNFILEGMEQGKAFDEAVAEAQRRGFAEADPAMDITGIDAAAKTCALANAFMRARLTPPEVMTRGIEDITPDDLIKAYAAGQKIKLLCRGFRDGDRVRGVVEPVRFPLTHPFVRVTGTSSVLTVETDLMGKITVIEHDPEIEQTAFGIYSDMLQLIR